MTSAPNMDALRDVGTESPSGRLVIDISRLRENRAASSSESDMTVITPAQAAEVLKRDVQGGAAKSVAGSPGKRSFPRVSVTFAGFEGVAKKPVLALAGLLVAALIIGAGLFAIYSRRTQPGTDPTVAASPSPTAEASPSASPTATPKREQKKPTAENANDNSNKKKESKVGSALKKVGRIFKKPF